MTKLVNDDLSELVERAAGGDREAFSAITRRQMKQVTALTYRMTGDHDAALDLAQDSFISAWQNLSRFRRDSSFSSWIYRIAVNTTLNYLKAVERREVAVESEAASVEPGTGDNPETTLVRKELAADVKSFVQSLPAAQRAIFELRFYKGLTFPEIAQVTNRAVGTVKTGYREAVKKLRTLAATKGWQ